MSKFAVIVQNDESPWNDTKGDLYHYPNKYKRILTSGCKIIYYKGSLKNKLFKHKRLTPDPHYFGIGIIGDSILDPDSNKSDRYCEILEYKEFKNPVPIKTEDKYIENIPESKTKNYWRDGVREITQDTYHEIISLAKIKNYLPTIPKIHEDFESYDTTEGIKKKRYSSYYERNPILRKKAIDFHGLNCMVCGFNFEKVYGELGKGFIHVHHNKPLSETGPTNVDPINDMSVVCPNCHAMIHRKKEYTLSIKKLIKIYNY